MKERTGFADVDGSGRSGELVDYLALAAQNMGDLRLGGYDMLRLRPGASVLDVGCGVGEVCVELAERVAPNGRVAGVDLSEAMIEAARRTVASAGKAVDLRVASVYALPFADGTFDAVRAERVFQHLDNPEAGLREMMRVTRPGGRLLVMDPDHGQAGMAVDEPAHRRVFEAIRRAMTAMVVNPHSGTRLRGMFARAGLVEIAQGTLSPDFSFPHYMQMFFVDERLAVVVDSGEITDQEARDFVAALEARHRDGTFFSNAIAYNVAGTKPHAESRKPRGSTMNAS